MSKDDVKSGSKIFEVDFCNAVGTVNSSFQSTCLMMEEARSKFIYERGKLKNLAGGFDKKNRSWLGTIPKGPKGPDGTPHRTTLPEGIDLSQ